MRLKPGGRFRFAVKACGSFKTGLYGVKKK